MYPAELLVRREAVKAGDELEVLADRADDHRHEQAAQLDRTGERVDVRRVEGPNVPRQLDPIELDQLGVTGGLSAHGALLSRRLDRLVRSPALGFGRPVALTLRGLGSLASAQRAVMKNSSTLTNGTSLGRRLAQRSISPSVNWPWRAAVTRWARLIAHMRASRRGSACKLPARETGSSARGGRAVAFTENLLGTVDTPEESAKVMAGVKARLRACRRTGLPSYRRAVPRCPPGISAVVTRGATLPGGAFFCLTPDEPSQAPEAVRRPREV